MSDYTDKIQEGVNRVYEHVEHKKIERIMGENNEVSWNEHVLFPKNTIDDVYLTSHSVTTISDKIVYHGDAYRSSHNYIELRLNADIDKDDVIKKGTHISITFHNDFNGLGDHNLPVNIKDINNRPINIYGNSNTGFLYKRGEPITENDIQMGDTIEFVLEELASNEYGFNMITNQETYFPENSEEGLYMTTIDKYGKISGYRRANSSDIPFGDIDYDWLREKIGLASNDHDGLMASTDYQKLHSFGDFSKFGENEISNSSKVYQVKQKRDSSDKNLYVYIPWDQDTDTQYNHSLSVSGSSNTSTSDINKSVSVKSKLHNLNTDTDDTKEVLLKGNKQIEITTHDNTVEFSSIHTDPVLCARNVITNNGSTTWNYSALEYGSSLSGEAWILPGSDAGLSGGSSNVSLFSKRSAIHISSFDMDNTSFPYGVYINSVVGYDFEAGNTVKTIEFGLQKKSGNNVQAISVNVGGTGQKTLNANEVLVGNGTNPITTTPYLNVSQGGTGQKTLNANEVLVGNGTNPITTREIKAYNSEDTSGLTTSNYVNNKINALQQIMLTSDVRNPAIPSDATKWTKGGINEYGFNTKDTNVLYEASPAYIQAIENICGETGWNMLLISPVIGASEREYNPIIVPKALFNYARSDSSGRYIRFWVPEFSILEGYSSLTWSSSSHPPKCAVITICVNINTGKLTKLTVATKNIITREAADNNIPLGLQDVKIYPIKKQA